MRAQPEPPISTYEADLLTQNDRLSQRCHVLGKELDLLKHHHQMLTDDLYRIAEALGIEEEGFGVTGKGIAPATILERIKELRRPS